MHIKPSAAIRQNYNEIAELCRSSREPVYLTKNGEGDLVVMDIESFTRREKMLELQEKLLEIERDRINDAAAGDVHATVYGGHIGRGQKNAERPRLLSRKSKCGGGERASQ